MAKLSVDQALSKAKSHAEKGEIEIAQKLYQAVLQAVPKNKRALQALASLNKLQQSVNVQDPPQETIDQLFSIYNQGQLQAVVEQANFLTKQYPKAFVVWNVLGAAAAQTGNLDLAILAFEKVNVIKPDYADAYYNKGIALKDQGKLEEAVKAYSKALSIKPDYAAAYNNMGIVLKDQGKLEEALEAYNKAVAIKPDFANAYNNIGIVLNEQGKLEEALEAFNKALSLKPDYADAHYNMGTILKDQGDLEEALEAFNKALLFKPDYADAYNNMGAALQDQGKLEEALEAYHKALATQPNYAEAYYNIGNVLKDQGKLEEALEAYNKAVAIKPDFADAYNNMGIVLRDQGKMEEALEACQRALLTTQFNYDKAYYNIGATLKGLVFKEPNDFLQKTIISLLDKKSYVRPNDISIAAISLLKFEPNLKLHLETPSMAQVQPKLLEVIKDLSSLPLLLNLMSVCPLPDVDLENLLRELRACLLLSISELTGSPEELEIQSALALQCFTNEYLYNRSKHEDEALAALEAAVKHTLNNGDQPNSQSILCLASYKPLHLYEWCSSLLVTDKIESVFKRQVEEPRQEVKLNSALPLLEHINDDVSLKVRDQYESSPYPRWVNLRLALKPLTISKVARELKLKLFNDQIKEVGAPQILIAGCGTGQHSIESAARFECSEVLAIDLSLASLGYAKRKTEELGIQNINYMHADILDLGKLSRQFDIVESSGVLHHMHDPIEGWRVLADCLKPGGLMRIGLYSELARQHIVEMRQEISDAGIGSSDAAMKSFRTMVINSEQNHHKQILSSPDFYSLSTLKDLLFHVQEHRFTIPKIQDCLQELGLKFCGFDDNKIVSQFRLFKTKADDLYDLEKWQEYEVANPEVFVGMYQFWCQKMP